MRTIFNYLLAIVVVAGMCVLAHRCSSGDAQAPAASAAEAQP